MTCPNWFGQTVVLHVEGTKYEPDMALQYFSTSFNSKLALMAIVDNNLLKILVNSDLGMKAKITLLKLISVLVQLRRL